MVAVTVVSRRSLEKVSRFFGEREWQSISQKVKIIPMGVFIQSGPAHTAPIHSPPRILFMGRLVEKKGVIYLFQAVKQLLNSGCELELQIAGDGPLRAELEREVGRLGLQGKVRFLGHVAGSVKAEVLESADVVVVPSIIAEDGDAEGLPVVILEALAVGKLCVATRESGADDILEDGKTGYLVFQKDADALAGAIRKSLDLDSEMRQKMSDGARQLARRFEWGKVAGETYDHLFSKL